MIKELFANKVIEVEGITSKDLKKEWNDQEYQFVNKIITNLFRRKTLTDHRGDKKRLISLTSIEDFFGLPYTSTSSFAGIWNTNTRFCLDVEEMYNIDGFALGNDNEVYIWCTDNDENVRVYKVLI